MLDLHSSSSGRAGEHRLLACCPVLLVAIEASSWIGYEAVVVAAAVCMNCRGVAVVLCCFAATLIAPCCLAGCMLGCRVCVAGGLHQQSWGDCGWSHRPTTRPFCCCIHTGVWAAVSGWHCTTCSPRLLRHVCVDTDMTQ
jgi:hypothetical protein